MRETKHLGMEEGVWQRNGWNSPAIMTLWSTIWPRLDPCLRTETKGKRGAVLVHKSRNGQITWKTCYNEMQKKKLFTRVTQN